MWEAIIAAVAAIGTAIYSNAQNKKRIAEQNQYNTPANQMARYTQAGLNPNLIYGQGNAGNQTAPAQFDAPDLTSTVPGVISKALAWKEAKKRMSIQDKDLILRDKAIQQADANIVNTYARTKNEDMEAMIKMLAGSKAEAESKYYSMNAKYSSEAQRAELQKRLRDIDLKGVQLVNQKLDSEIKSSVLTEKQYYNYMRQFGVEKGDNPFVRGGLGLLRTIPRFFNQKIRGVTTGF